MLLAGLRWSCCVLLVALGILLHSYPVRLAAQDPIPLETFSSEQNHVTFQYPSGWVAEQTGANQIYVGSTPEALEQIGSSAPQYPPGTILVDVSVNVGPATPGIVWTPDEFMQTMIPALGTALPDATVGEVESVTIAGNDAARLKVVSTGLEAEVVLYAIQSGNGLTLLTVTGHLGDIAEFEDEILSIAESIRMIPAGENPPAAQPTAVAATPAINPAGGSATYASPNDVFTFAYPSDWLLHDPNEEVAGVLVGNTQNAIDQAAAMRNWNFSFDPGSVLISVRSVPGEGMTLSGLANAADFVIRPNLGSDGEMNTEPISLEGMNGYRTDATSESKDLDVVLLTFASEGDLISHVMALAPRGGLADFEDDILAMAQSIQPASASGELPAQSTSTPVAPVATPAGTPVKGASTTPTSQPAETTLAYGETVSAELTTSDGDRWAFVGEEGDRVAIRMTADFDNYLELYDPDGNLVTENDDSGGNLNAYIEPFELPASGEYTIVARAFAPEVAGEYTLQISQPTLPTPGPMEIGDIVTTVLSGDDDEWTFEGVQGSRMTILLVGSFDTVLELYAPDGTRIASSDDTLQNNISYVDELILPDDGEYTILVRAYSTGTEGDYLLALGRPFATASD